ncbi:MAG: CopG family antitoxin [Candidatus Sumerlaeota bacterium]|nr:CopG family antitoxin [Candidatus Sumerlaeota bacterium]
MSANKLPEFSSIGEIVEFFDTHDLGENNLPEAQFEVDIQKRACLIAVDGALMKKLSRVANAQHISTEALVRMWLEEKAAHGAQPGGAGTIQVSLHAASRLRKYSAIFPECEP